MTEVVVSYLSDEARVHTEDGCAGDRVCCRTSGHELDSHRLERLPYLVSGLHVDMLHAAFGEVELLEETVVRKYCQDVCEGVSDA